MQTLNLKSKKTFCRITDAMNGKPYIKLKAKRFLPLTIELLEFGIETPLGKARAYSFCNYIKRNGDLIQVPEMCFLVIDNRKDDPSEDLDQVTIIPYMFQYAEISVYESSALFFGNVLIGVKERMQMRHCLLAQIWLSEIETIGYLKS